VRTYIDRVLGRFGYYRQQQITGNSGSVAAIRESSLAQYFQLLWAYYDNNDLYDAALVSLRGIETDGLAIKSLRNPANRAVEFYASTIAPGKLPEALPIMADNERIIEPIQQIWNRSNWSNGKQVSIRHMAATGNTFIKIAQRESDKAPYLQVIRPDTVSDVAHDERGHVVQIRIDTPILRDDRQYTRTEYWTPDEVRIWEHQRGDAPVANLGDPLQRMATADMGIDFVPVVHIKFRETGNTYGAGCFVHVIDKIDGVNMQMTHLNRMVFKPVIWALTANGTDQNGRPLPAVAIKSPDGKSDLNIADAKRDTMIRLPGVADVKSLVPNLPYADVLAVIESLMAEIECDLPEMRYWRMIDSAESGRAVERKLAPAISRAIEARGNWEAGLARAHMMALSIGVEAGTFRNIGSYEAGDFAHSFEARAVLPVDAMDIAELVTARGTAGQLPHAQRWRELGFSDEQIAQLNTEREADIEQSARALLSDQIVGVR